MGKNLIRLACFSVAFGFFFYCFHFNRETVIKNSDLIAQVNITRVECTKTGGCYSQQAYAEPMQFLKGHTDGPFWIKIARH